MRRAVVEFSKTNKFLLLACGHYFEAWNQPWEYKGINAISYADCKICDENVSAVVSSFEYESEGAERIAAERARQIKSEHWTAEHDASYLNGELVDAAVCYAETVAKGYEDFRFIDEHWPWLKKWWKPDTDLRMLEKAGALIAAELDRRIARKRDGH